MANPSQKKIFTFELVLNMSPRKFRKGFGLPKLYFKATAPGQGIFPDVMHITHLALAPDVITSCLLDWSDDSSYFSGGSRDRRLNEMWQSYRSWCESQSYPMSERAQRKLFTSSVLKPDHGHYTEISQKVLNASAARYMLFWISPIAKQFAEWFQADEDMQLGYRLILLESEPLFFWWKLLHFNTCQFETMVAVCLDISTLTLQIFFHLWW